MKKYLFLSGIALAISSLVMRLDSGVILDKLAGAQSELVSAQKEVTDATNELKDTYNGMQDNISKLNEGINEVNKQSKDVSSTIETINKIPGFVLSAAGMKDLPTTLHYIHSILTDINTTLTDIQTGLAAANVDLNPQTDPQNVYAHFKTSCTDFGIAIEELISLQKKLGGKPSTQPLSCE